MKLEVVHSFLLFMAIVSILHVASWLRFPSTQSWQFPCNVSSLSLSSYTHKIAFNANMNIVMTPKYNVNYNKNIGRKLIEKFCKDDGKHKFVCAVFIRFCWLHKLHTEHDGFCEIELLDILGYYVDIKYSCR